MVILLRSDNASCSPRSYACRGDMRLVKAKFAVAVIDQPQVRPWAVEALGEISLLCVKVGPVRES